MALTKTAKENICKTFGKQPQDSGSMGVQIALLSHEINKLTEHLQKNAKDFSSKRGMLSKIGRRKKMLDYIARTDVTLHKDITKRLDIK
jgi:small subunit ribosomal protein S15